MLGTGMTPDAGGIKIGGDIGKATINGDLAGGAGDNSGGLQAANIGSVTVGGSLLGGDGASSGGIQSTKTITMARIGGSIIGGNVGIELRRRDGADPEVDRRGGIDLRRRRDFSPAERLAQRCSGRH